MQTTLSILQIVVSVLLIIVVLLQNRGSGLSGAFGPQAGVFRTRRGLERILFRVTIALTVVFLVVALLNVRFYPAV
ncbi:MAG: preprotein translocase subunit SecG [Chloroflexi bacterium]|nr:preprotein translocase subunit SecG [Chloroflexota bacterium]